MKKAIRLKEVLDKMKQVDAAGDAVKFDISVREYNRQNKSGGKLKEYEDVSLVFSTAKDKKTISAKSLMYVREITASKDPNHFANRTRNLKMQDGEIRKINILLITEFNNQKVVY